MGGYGNLTIIDHGNGLATAYAHQSAIYVGGGSVSQGTVIGAVGSTGKLDRPAPPLRGARERFAGRPDGLPLALGREPQPQRDQDGPGDGFERPLDARPAQEAPCPGDDDRVGASARRASSRRRAARARSSGTNAGSPAGTNCGRRLGKKAAIFGFPRLLTRPWRTGGPRREAGGAGRLERSTSHEPAAPGRQKRLDAQEDEVGGAGQPHRGEGRLGSERERGHAEARRQRPDRLAAHDPEGGRDPAGSAAEERVSDRQGRVGPGRHDHEDGDAEEADQLGRRMPGAYSSATWTSGRPR